MLMENCLSGADQSHMVKLEEAFRHGSETATVKLKHTTAICLSLHVYSLVLISAEILNWSVSSPRDSRLNGINLSHAA